MRWLQVPVKIHASTHPYRSAQPSNAMQHLEAGRTCQTLSMPHMLDQQPKNSKLRRASHVTGHNVSAPPIVVCHAGVCALQRPHHVQMFMRQFGTRQPHVCLQAFSTQPHDPRTLSATHHHQRGRKGSAPDSPNRSAILSIYLSFNQHRMAHGTHSTRVGMQA